MLADNSEGADSSRSHAETSESSRYDCDIWRNLDLSGCTPIHVRFGPTPVLTSGPDELRPREYPIHLVGRVSLHRRRHVTVQVKRDADLRVTQHLRYDLGMDTSPEHQCGRGVPQIMEAYSANQRALEVARTSCGVPKLHPYLDGCVAHQDTVAIPAQQRFYPH